MPTSLQCLRCPLRAVTALEIATRDRRGPVATSRLRVAVTADGDTLRFDETGTRTLATGASFQITNALLWTFADDTLSLAYHRFGQTVPLVTFTGPAHTRMGWRAWRNQAPHPCGEDRYAASLAWRPGGPILMYWRVTGPHKDHWMRYRYDACPPTDQK